MKKYILPPKLSDKIDFIHRKYNNIINSNNITMLANECKSFAALNDELRNTSGYRKSSNYIIREDYNLNNIYNWINNAKNENDIETLKNILTQEGNEILEILTHNDFKLMSLKITTPMKEKIFEVWDVDKQEVERDRKKKIVKSKTRKPVKKCRCKK